MAYKFLPDLRFLPDNLKEITASTPIADGVPLGTFLKGTTLDHIPKLEDRKQLIRNLLPQAHIVKSIREGDKRFSKYKLVVVEGVYKKSPQEKLTAKGQKELALTGRSVVYELRRNGKTDTTKTVELARYIVMFYRTYSSVRLDYDTYASGELNAQLIIDTPFVPASYDVKFDLQAETAFNNKVQARNEIVEITEKPRTEVELPAPSTDAVDGYFTVGDHHAKLLQQHGGTPWQSFASDGRTALGDTITTNISKIKRDSVVVISAGYNDTINSNTEDWMIAADVFGHVAESLVLDHVVTFLLFPITNEATVQRQTSVRNEIVEAISGFNNLRIIDLNEGQYQLDTDGRSMTREAYIKISNVLV